MIAHVITQLVMLSIQVSLLLLVAVLVFSIPCHGNVLTILGLTLLLGMAGMLYGLFLSSICADEQECVQYSTGSFFPVMLLSGILWPVEGIPGVLRYLALSLPTTWAATALRDLMARGWGWANDSVWQAYLVVFGKCFRTTLC
jgi:ABC-type multidrug transport system permease subunit